MNIGFASGSVLSGSVELQTQRVANGPLSGTASENVCSAIPVLTSSAILRGRKIAVENANP
jgi:hypothetical protein